MAESGIREALPEVGGDDDPVAIVEALRDGGAEGRDAVRFRFIEALARRGSSLEGEARQRVRVRFDRAVAECRARIAAPTDEVPAPAPVSPLAMLVREIESRADATWMTRSAPPGAEDPGARRELKSLRYFRQDWSRLGVEQQLARALAQAPRNAGPLNSHGLILQSLKAMRDLSPACLERTMAWLDTLLWLDDATSAPAPAERPPSRPAAGRAPAKAPGKTSRTVRSKAR